MKSQALVKNTSHTQRILFHTLTHANTHTHTQTHVRTLAYSNICMIDIILKFIIYNKNDTLKITNVMMSTQYNKYFLPTKTIIKLL